MKSNDLSFPEVKALVMYAKVGAALFAARMLSLVSLCGFLALAFYVAYPPVSWIGAVVVGIAAIVFMAALRAERAPAQNGAPSDG